MQYYPVFLNLTNRRVVVIGGGKMAHEKVEGLLNAGACVRVIAPNINPQLQELVNDKRIEYIPREYQYGDLEGTFLVICATENRSEHAEVYAEANTRNIMVNAVDDPARCSFIAPSILRRGDLTIAISTSGKAPAVAVRLRQKLEEQIGDEYTRFLELAGTLRAPLAERYPDFETRKELWYQLVDSDVLELLREGNEEAAVERIAELTGIYPQMTQITQRKIKSV